MMLIHYFLALVGFVSAFAYAAPMIQDETGYHIITTSPCGQAGRYIGAECEVYSNLDGIPEQSSSEVVSPKRTDVLMRSYGRRALSRGHQLVNRSILGIFMAVSTAASAVATGLKVISKVKGADKLAKFLKTNPAGKVIGSMSFFKRFFPESLASGKEVRRNSPIAAGSVVLRRSEDFVLD
ncbi:hypothetical protein FRC03_008497 [Tulasnella sp. 419]|nr:hypothetical protein FRC03_008497 [Tulasnella sp. 419]